MGAGEPVPIKTRISFEEFDQVDIRVGEIVEVSDVPGSKKLVRLTVDLGTETRNVLVSMKGERDDLTALVGRQALFVVNLEPREMAGEVSDGMLFDIGYADGLPPVLAVPEEPVPNGTRAG